MFKENHMSNSKQTIRVPITIQDENKLDAFGKILSRREINVLFVSLIIYAVLLFLFFFYVDGFSTKGKQFLQGFFMLAFICFTYRNMKVSFTLDRVFGWKLWGLTCYKLYDVTFCYAKQHSYNLFISVYDVTFENKKYLLLANTKYQLSEGELKEKSFRPYLVGNNILLLP